MFRIFNGQTRGLGESPQLEIFLNIGVKFRQYLHHFKGADLHVFLSILLHADDRGWSSPSLKQIKQETGYENSTISASLTRLCDTKIDGKRLLFAMQERTKGKFQKNAYLIFPTDEEITLHGKETRKPRVSNSPSTEKPNTVEPNSENQRDGINHAWEEPVVEEDNSFSDEKVLQSADADVQSAPSHPQSSDGQQSAENAQTDSVETTSTQGERIPDPLQSSAKGSPVSNDDERLYKEWLAAHGANDDFEDWVYAGAEPIRHLVKKGASKPKPICGASWRNGNPVGSTIGFRRYPLCETCEAIALKPPPPRPAQPHIGVIEAFLEPFLKELPADFKIGSCARVGMDLVKAGVTIDTMRDAGLLYRAWYDAIPSRTGVSWSVAAISSATSFARHMAADPLITPEYVTKYVAHIYQDEWWHDKLLTFKKVYENIGVWLHYGESPRKPATAPAIEMDENGMPIGYREMQEARRRADAIVAEKRRNGELR